MPPLFFTVFRADLSDVLSLIRSTAETREIFPTVTLTVAAAATSTSRTKRTIKASGKNAKPVVFTRNSSPITERMISCMSAASATDRAMPRATAVIP